QKDAGYTISHPKQRNGTGLGTMGTLIVGVVGQETMKAVSPTFLAVGPPNNCEEKKAGLPCDEMDSMKGKVTTLDPLRTIMAVLRGTMQMDVCDKRPSCGEKEKSKEREQFDRIVVMAQMPRPEAEQLSAQLRVSLKNAKAKEQD